MALVAVLIVISLMTVLGSALTLMTITETAVAANYRDAAEALYAAEGAAAFVIQEIALLDDWSDVVEGRVRSTFTDGASLGAWRIGSVVLDFAAVTAEVDAVAIAPAGARQGTAVLYAHGPFASLVAADGPSAAPYVAVWVSDRSGEDADVEKPPDVISVVAHAYGVGGGRRIVEALAVRDETSAVRVRAWRELR